jgi:hypothetical protein
MNSQKYSLEIVGKRKLEEDDKIEDEEDEEDEKKEENFDLDEVIFFKNLIH